MIVRKMGTAVVSAAAGFFVMAVGTVVASQWPNAALGLLAVVAAAYAAATASPVGALATSVWGWLFLDGFVVHQYGDLGWDGWADVVRLGVLVAAAVVGTAIGLAQRKSTVPVATPRNPFPVTAHPVQ